VTCRSRSAGGRPHRHPPTGWFRRRSPVRQVARRIRGVAIGLPYARECRHADSRSCGLVELLRVFAADQPPGRDAWHRASRWPAM